MKSFLTISVAILLGLVATDDTTIEVVDTTDPPNQETLDELAEEAGYDSPPQDDGNPDQ